MFSSSPFNRDPFHRLPIPTAFSYSNYIGPGVIPHLHSQHTHEPPHHHRRQQNAHSPHHRRPSRHHRQSKRHTHYEDTEASSSERDTPDEAYYTPPPSPHPFPSHLHDTRRSSKHNDANNALNLASGFRSLHARVSRFTAEHFGRDDILILPPTLTRLRVQIRSAYGSETLHATVAGDMRFRDAVKQVVPDMYHGEMRVCVKMRGAWQETGGYRVSQITEQGRFVLNERGEVDVKIEIGGRGSVKVGVRGTEAWERGRMRDV